MNTALVLGITGGIGGEVALARSFAAAGTSARYIEIPPGLACRKESECGAGRRHETRRRSSPPHEA